MMIYLEVIVLIAVVAAQSGQVLSKIADGDDLEALCAGKNTNLYRLSQLDALVSKLNNDGAGRCSDNTVNAIHDLSSVKYENEGQECTMAAYERYKQFYSIYLDRSDKEKKETTPKLPGPLKNLALAYGLQLSGRCRTNMVRVLLEEGRQAVDEADFDGVKELIGADGPIATALGYEGNKPDELVLPSDFMSIIYRGENSGQKLNIQIATTPVIKRIQALCERRFEPVYKPLILPVARLANLGFIHRSRMLKKMVKKTLKDQETGDMISQWSRVVFMCEILNEIQIVEIDEDKEQSEGSDVLTVNVRAGSYTRPKGKDLLEETEINLDDIVKSDFKPNLSMKIRDDVLGKPSQRLALAWIDTSRDESTNIRIRLGLKILSRFKHNLTNYRLIAFFEDAYKLIAQVSAANKEKKKDNEDVSTSLVKSINELIDRRMNPDSTVMCEYCSEDPADPRVVWGLIIGVVLLLVVVGVWQAGKATLVAGTLG